jgi:hypothetical protein
VVVERIDRAMPMSDLVHWRVLLRGSMAEVYVNDVLLLPLPLRNTVAPGGYPSWAAGVRPDEVVVGLTGAWANSTNVQAWSMSLPPLFPQQ